MSWIARTPQWINTPWNSEYYPWLIDSYPWLINNPDIDWIPRVQPTP